MSHSLSCFHRCAWVLLIMCGLVGTLQAACPDVVNGVSYPNLPKLTNSGDASGDWLLKSTDSVMYNWNICVEQQFCQQECGAAGTVVCQNCNYPQTTMASLGVISSQEIVTVPGINSVNFLYSQGKYSSDCGKARSSNISVVCTPSSPTAAVNVAEVEPCVFSITMTSSYSCSNGYAFNPLVPDQAAAMADLQKVWGARLGWAGNASLACSIWAGITCKQAGIYSIVQTIDVSGQGLTGAIPPSFGNLNTLTSFNCSHNPSIGGQIPASITQISNLAALDLSYSGLTGPLPLNFFTLKLSVLNLQVNQLNGGLPSNICGIPSYNAQGNAWNCPLPTCCGSSGNFLCVPCQS